MRQSIKNFLKRISGGAPKEHIVIFEHRANLVEKFLKEKGKESMEDLSIEEILEFRERPEWKAKK